MNPLTFTKQALSRSTVWQPLAVAAALTAATGLPVVAQAEESADKGAYEEIIVTARKRSESVQDIPFSINVVSEEMMANLGADDFTDILGTVPSLTAYRNGSGRTRLSIRGIANGGGNDNDTQNQETVSIYLDEIPISAGAMNPELGLFDLDRVEVLRGPQGTLYGAGAMTGTIRLVSKKPDLNEFGGKYELEAGTITKGGEDYSVKGLLNIPVVEDVFAIRASTYYTEQGGYIDNVLTGEDDLNEGEQKGFRIAARLQLGDNFTADLSYFDHDYSDDGRDEDLDRTKELARDYPSFDGYDDDMEIYNLTLTMNLGWGELVSSTSYFDRTVVNRRSLDALFTLALPPGITPHELVDTTDTWLLVQEVRLSSTTDSPFQWTIGAYWDKRDVFYLNTFPVPGADAVLGVDSSVFGAPSDHLYYGYDDLQVETYAFFGEAYYNIGRWNFTLGLRHFDWKQNIEFYQSGLFNGGFNTDVRPEGNVDDLNPKLNISYDLSDDVLIYAQAAKGFRYGGINGVIPENVCAAELAEVAREGGDTRFFDSDELWNYEVGVKGAAAEGMLVFNATVFRMDWTDMQTQRSFMCGFGFRENVGKATSEGLELELTARLSDNLTMTLGGAYINSELDEDVPNLDAEEGDPAPFVPELAINSTVEYSQPLNDRFEGFVWAQARYTDDRGTEFSKQHPNYRKMDSYTTADSRLGVRWGNYELSLYVNNVFDSRGVLRALRRPPFDPDSKIRVRPRTVGITFRGDF